MNWKKVIYTIIILAFLYSIAIMFITSHEAIHYQIFARYDVESEISFDFFPVPKGVVVPFGDYKLCNDSCKLQHALNDIIGYNLVVLISFLLVLNYIKKEHENN